MNSSVLDQIQSMGISGRISKQEMRSNCPFHEDRTPSFSINLESGVWICFAGCGKGTFLELIERLKDREYAPVITSSPRTKQTTILQSWINRGITAQICENWDITYDPEMNAMHIPVYNNEGNELVGHIWRKPEGEEPKYLYNSGFPKTEILFGIWKDQTCSQTILVEGPLDAIWLHETGNLGLAVFGSILYGEQIQLLLKMRIKKVLLAFDNDPTGIRGSKEAARLLQKEGIWVDRILWPKSIKDIQQVPLDKVPNILSRKEPCVNGTGVIHPRFKRWR